MQRWRFDFRSGAPGALEQALNDLRISFDGGDPARLFMQALRVQGFTVLHLRSTAFGVPGQITWHPSSGNGDRRYLFVLVPKGDLRIATGTARYAHVGTGFAVGFPGKEPVSFSTDSPIEAVCVTFDANVVEPLVIDPTAVQHANTSSSVFNASYSALLALVTATEDPTPEENARAIRSALSGVSRGLTWELQAPPDSLYDLAMSLIVERHTDPDLTPQSIADSLGVSAATLRRRFSEQGNSVSEELRAHRVETMMRLTEQLPNASALALCRIAGFGSIDSWRRARDWYSRSRAERLEPFP